MEYRKTPLVRAPSKQNKSSLEKGIVFGQEFTYPKMPKVKKYILKSDLKSGLPVVSCKVVFLTGVPLY